MNKQLQVQLLVSKCEYTDSDSVKRGGKKVRPTTFFFFFFVFSGCATYFLPSGVCKIVHVGAKRGRNSGSAPDSKISSNATYTKEQLVISENANNPTQRSRSLRIRRGLIDDNRYVKDADELFRSHERHNINTHKNHSEWET